MKVKHITHDAVRSTTFFKVEQSVMSKRRDCSGAEIMVLFVFVGARAPTLSSSCASGDRWGIETSSWLCACEVSRNDGPFHHPPFPIEPVGKYHGFPMLMVIPLATLPPPPPKKKPTSTPLSPEARCVHQSIPAPSTYSNGDTRPGSEE